MPSPAAYFPATRRFLAALLGLGVLLNALGSSHSSCDETGGPMMVTATNHHDMARVPADPAHDSHDGHGNHCPDSGRSGAENEMCAMVAHCNPAAVATVVRLATTANTLTQPALSIDGGPLEGARQPESPPPKT